jgi:hypothetical protein
VDDARLTTILKPLMSGTTARIAADPVDAAQLQYLRHDADGRVDRSAGI